MATLNIEKNGRVFSYMRWSSEPQTWGDSERRQMEAAEAWCQRNGRTMASRTFTDRGVSGWKGDNRRQGALGALLRTAQAGDTILIEDCDRWSRESPLDSLNALRDTVNRGVEIVFLKTGVRVNDKNFNDPTVLFPNFFGSFLANAENEKRSYRIKQAMEGKRQALKVGKLTFGRLPAWLIWDSPATNANRKIIVVPEKAATVKRIFKLCLEGYGCRGIGIALRDTPPIANSKRTARWNGRFIHRLLTDKAVLGFHHESDKPVYPAIIDTETFYAAAAKLADRKKYTVIVKHENNNLFTGLAFCAKCSRPLIRQSCFTKTGKYRYLMCRGGFQHEGCPCGCKGIRYDAFELTILSIILAQGDTLRRVLSGQLSGPSELDAKRAELADIEGESSKILRLIDGMDNPPKKLAERLAALELRENRLREEVLASEAQAKLATPPVRAYDELRESVSYNEVMKDRHHVRQLLSEMIKRITVNLEEKSFVIHFRGVQEPMPLVLIKA